MRLNIKEIVQITGCTECRAIKIENYIDEAYLLDWSYCTKSEAEHAILAAHRMTSEVK